MGCGASEVSTESDRNAAPSNVDVTTASTGPQRRWVQIPSDKVESGYVRLSPFDYASAGRPVPMVWFYPERLDLDAMVATLEKTLEKYQLFTGRYAAPPEAVQLNNQGIPVEVVETSGSAREAAETYLPLQEEYKVYPRHSNAAFLPSAEIHAKMDPDKFDPEVPLLAVKLTRFADGGTALGLLLMHAVADAQTEILFLTNWSQTFRHLPMDPLPVHQRCPPQVCGDEISDSDLTAPSTMKMRCVPQDEPVIPEFAPAMPKIMGQSICAFNFPKTTVDRMVAAAKVSTAEALDEGRYFSTDDVLSAQLWKAMVKLRCRQLEIPENSEDITTSQRACNFRGRCEPKLGHGYCGNGVTQVWTEMRVKDILAADISTIALQLRADLQKFTSATVPLYGRWLQKKQKEGFKVVPVFDALALTFVISSWNFAWHAADFGFEPFCFDHAALVPIVCTMVPRPKQDGFMVYAQGPEDSMQYLAEYLHGATAPASAG